MLQEFWGPIAVAVIMGPVVILLKRFERRNDQQHGANMGVLERIESKVERLDERMDNHLDWHMKDDQ